jgi:quercetin dioxygenase-like cupin family protein
MENLTEKIINFNEMVDYAEGSIISKQILIKKAGNITLFSFDQGQKLSEHTAPFDAMVQIIDGTGEVFIAGNKYTLNVGETIIMPADVPHAVNAVEKFKMLLTMIKSKD